MEKILKVLYGVFIIWGRKKKKEKKMGTKIPAYEEKRPQEAPPDGLYQGVICGAYNLGEHWDMQRTRKNEKWCLAIELDVLDSTGHRYVVCTKAFSLFLSDKSYLPTLIKAALPTGSIDRAKNGLVEMEEFIGRNVQVQTSTNEKGYPKIEAITMSRDHTLKIETARDFIPPLVRYYRNLAETEKYAGNDDF